MRAAVIGVGHSGQHHARILASLPGVSLAGVVDINAARAAKIAAEYGTRAFGDVREIDGTVDARRSSRRRPRATSRSRCR